MRKRKTLLQKRTSYLVFPNLQIVLEKERLSGVEERNIGVRIVSLFAKIILC